MGHLRLSTLPDLAAWHRVVEFVADDSTVDAVAAATIEAASSALNEASHDAGLHRVVQLLVELCEAGRATNVIDSLSGRGIRVSQRAGTFDLLAAFAEAADRGLRAVAGRRSDFADMARTSAVEALTSVCATAGDLLYTDARGDVQEALRRLSSPSGFESLAHGFFARLTYRFLAYHLSRDLSAHVGPNQRFAGPEEHNEFLESLRAFSVVSASIVREFASGWFARHGRAGPIPAEEAHRFAAYAMTKVRRSVAQRGRGDVA